MKVLIFLACILPALAEGAVNLKGRGGEVRFLAVGKPSMLKIHGKAADPEATFKIDGEILSGSAEIAMEKFQTGIGLRDKHMKEKYLQTAEFPKATLTLNEMRVDPGFAASLSAPAQTFEGVLSLHGKEKPIKGNFSATNGAIQAKFPLTLTDFGVEVPSYLGVTVAESVDVEVNLPLVRE